MSLFYYAKKAGLTNAKASSQMGRGGEEILVVLHCSLQSWVQEVPSEMHYSDGCLEETDKRPYPSHTAGRGKIPSDDSSRLRFWHVPIFAASQLTRQSSKRSNCRNAASSKHILETCHLALLWLNYSWMGRISFKGTRYGNMNS